MSKNMLIIDVNSILDFACKTLPSYVSEKKEEINGILGFSRMLFSAIQMEDFTHSCGVVKKQDCMGKQFEEQFERMVTLMKAMEISIIETEDAMNSIADRIACVKSEKGKRLFT